jgi:hypothetical protein
MSKVYNLDNLNIKVDKEKKLLYLPLKRINEYTKKEYIDKSLTIREFGLSKIVDTVYNGIKLLEILEEDKIYSYEETINYLDYVKTEINVDDVLFFYEDKEPWFQMYMDLNKLIMTVDPLFTNINKLNNHKNFIYIPRNKNVIRNFSPDRFIDKSDFNESARNFAVILKDVGYEFGGMDGINMVVNIKFDISYILSKSNLRALKIKNLIL